MVWKLLIGLVLLGAVGLVGWVRLAPVDAAAWHVDPRSAPDPATPNFARIAPGVVVAEDAAALAARVDAAMLALPRTRRIAGTPAEGLMTYQTRSRLMGFPDYTSIAVFPEGEAATLAALARARFGSSDLGVNAARLEALRAALAAPAR
jgi:uncharacterized protein (DUF1499 family)